MITSTAVLFVGSALLAFLIAVAATPAVAAVARRFGLLDIPGGRRQHPAPIPRIGGLAIAIAFGLTVFVFWLVDRFAGHPFLIPAEVRSPQFTLTALAAGLGLGIGLLDDALDLRARWQFLGYLAIAAIIVAAGIRIDFVNDPRGDGLIQLAPPIAIAFCRCISTSSRTRRRCSAMRSSLVCGSQRSSMRSSMRVCSAATVESQRSWKPAGLLFVRVAGT